MLHTLKTAFRSEEFYATSELPPGQFGKRLQHVFGQLPPTTFAGKADDRSFELFSLLEPRFRGPGDPRLVRLEGSYSGNGHGTRVHFRVSAHKGYALLAVISTILCLTNILSGAVWSVYTKDLSWLGLVFSGSFLLLLPVGICFLAQRAKNLLKAQFIRLLNLTSE